MKEIAIDGPAGAGKSTIAKALSKILGYNYLDTGAMYRACAFYMLGRNINPDDDEKVSLALPDMHMRIYYSDAVQHVEINSQDVSPYIRSSEIAFGASAVGKNTAVRKKLVKIQREISKKYNIIMDGRDIGTYVLPDADYKFYITADVKERAKRRLLEHNEIITEKSLLKAIDDINSRDKNDSERLFAPLKQADDAILIDTTGITQEQAIQKILTYINES